MNSLVIVQKSLLASSSSRVESSWSNVAECNSSYFLWRISQSRRSGRSKVKVDVLRRCSHHRFWLFHLRLGISSFHFFAALWIPLHWPFGRGVLMCLSFNSSMSANIISPFQFLPAYNTKPKNTPNKTFGPNWCNCDVSSQKLGDLHPSLQTVSLVR